MTTQATDTHTVGDQPPAGPITDLPHLRIYWRRAVRRDTRLSWAEVAVLLELEDHTDLDGTNAFPGRERLAERAIDHGRTRTPYTVRTVNDALKRGRELGYLVRTEESRKRPDGSRTADVYRVALPVDALELADLTPANLTATKQPLGGSEPAALGETRTSPHQIPHHQPLETTSTKTSVAAAAATAFTRRNGDSFAEKWRTGEATPGARSIHPQWTPNNANRAVAAELGVNLAALAQVFREQMAAAGERRRNWGAAFTAFLRDYAANYRSTTTFGFIDHDTVDQLIGEQVDDAIDQLIAAGPIDPPAAASTGQAPPPRRIPKDMSAKITKAERIVGPLLDHERAFVVSLLEADPAATFAALAGEVERLRDTARDSGGVA
ncbi:Uncharacterised protein [Mycobacteroides abscessus subsp. abscessus]|nr:Uncharacterised protein [Mycobacteroides abscessus subsp. abscessus]